SDKARFIADARAKAHVQHPAILSVYEAGESGGRTFYAHEYVDGRNLEEIAASGEKIDEPTALKVLRVTGEALAYLNLNHVPHTPVGPTKIYLAVDGQPRVANLATQLPDHQISVEAEIQTLGGIIRPVVSEEGISPGLRALLGRMHVGPGGVGSWANLLKAVKTLEPKVVPAEAARINARDRAAIAAVEAARQQQKRGLILVVATMVSLFALAVFVVWKFVFQNRERTVEEMVHIPAGNYLVGERKVALPEFWISKYEVTVGQYARFMKYVRQHPEAELDLKHPRQPPDVSYEPDTWQIFYPRAKQGKPVRSAPYSLDSPAVEVNWYAAYAYAKWRGRELPTEEQWEAAGRGEEGFVYPWGNAFDPKKVNSASDYKENDPGAPGEIDGWNLWNPVDAVKGDRSPFGVIGLAGNVSEWTGTMTADNRPIIKGGSYLSANVRLDKRFSDEDPRRGREFIGFRTVSKKQPQD
ncbi:MAG: SUMF1/EgtB/PvdO family nonheme iron enzyme, partial [Verrucomicrobiota bacterium]|nr:SUMF1/EgtB/PvdO family nonheme iron enzyme [Verrucomicrobiota bacterium]